MSLSRGGIKQQGMGSLFPSPGLSLASDFPQKSLSSSWLNCLKQKMGLSPIASEWKPALKHFGSVGFFYMLQPNEGIFPSVQREYGKSIHFHRAACSRAIMLNSDFIFFIFFNLPFQFLPFFCSSRVIFFTWSATKSRN